jgi:hypothetical protein
VIRLTPENVEMAERRGRKTIVRQRVRRAAK